MRAIKQTLSHIDRTARLRKNFASLSRKIKQWQTGDGQRHGTTQKLPTCPLPNNTTNIIKYTVKFISQSCRFESILKTHSWNPEYLVLSLQHRKIACKFRTYFKTLWWAWVILFGKFLADSPPSPHYSQGFPRIGYKRNRLCQVFFHISS